MSSRWDYLRVDARQSLVLPKAYRRRHDIATGTYFMVRYVGAGVMLIPWTDEEESPPDAASLDRAVMKAFGQLLEENQEAYDGEASIFELDELLRHDVGFIKSCLVNKSGFLVVDYEQRDAVGAIKETPLHARVMRHPNTGKAVLVVAADRDSLEEPQQVSFVTEKHTGSAPLSSNPQLPYPPPSGKPVVMSDTQSSLPPTSPPDMSAYGAPPPPPEGED